MRTRATNAAVARRRGVMLTAMLSGRAWSTGTLARIAGITTPQAYADLRAMRRLGLVVPAGVEDVGHGSIARRWALAGGR